MEKEEYFAAIQNLRPPSLEEIQNFTKYVSRAHSWYKHLTLTRPGVACFFYIDPNAEKDEVATKDGVVYVAREERGWHYNLLPSQEYLDNFGHWKFIIASISLESMRKNNILPDEKLIEVKTPSLKILSLEGNWLSVPKDFLREHCVFINASIHPHQNPTLWSGRFDTGLLGEIGLDFPFLPTTVQDYLRHINISEDEINTNYHKTMFEAFIACHEKERNYQINNMVETMRQITLQIYGSLP